jgi:hypothetical protein
MLEVQDKLAGFLAHSRVAQHLPASYWRRAADQDRLKRVVRHKPVEKPDKWTFQIRMAGNRLSSLLVSRASI